MNDKAGNIIDVLGGNREIMVGMEPKDMALLGFTMFASVLLALIVARLIFPK